MKKFLFFISLVVIMTIFVACFPSKKPEKIAKKFVTAIENLDFDKAKKYATPESAQMLNFAEAIIPDYARILRKNNKVKVDFVEKSIDEEKEEATVCFFVANRLELNSTTEQDPQIIEKNETVVIVLKKIDGKWLVDSEDGFYFN